MINCCIHNKTHKKCVRKSDNKIFSLPRRFTRRRCQQGIHGFTMRSSCAPYKDCIHGGSKSKKREKGKKLAQKRLAQIRTDMHCSHKQFLYKRVEQFEKRKSKKASSASRSKI